MTIDMTDVRAVETTWDPTRRDIRRAVVLVLGAGKYYGLAALVIALGVVATVLGVETTADGLEIPTFWLPPALVSAVLFALVPQLVGRQAWRRNPLVRLREQVRVDTAGVTSTNELVTTRFAWAALKVAFETDHVFALATKKGSGALVLVVPKDASVTTSW